ncbi:MULTISPECIES: dihydrolipoyl dehydrogenase [unclassified Streptomyces]|uniref:dihydrolipoyl dehydrogenase n=1 Tax=unclassified Streptomyces TaxID=2593676 RepID=UPI002DDB4EB4|nr:MULTISPECIES: dihydrolipoyl dehydrogenase [unclassified Streptomyces]WSA95227.1 dihydrolipoyl dehydrogenase [Streptomyces sp. NBC_01795]WSB79645.1 dihydrolipoyl dehydrogenase [Streptomyces sp. NBC_01775]WSS12152.1 dihydrolipoyl dehydrogenase [Streptomyces sp. NBC_01186]WSS40863.1 dihydrolipoyl dehydrogenase [Streptomyces sp. NBC_01187]
MANDASTVFDLVILGGGSGGYAAAFRAAQLGLDVALIEKDKVGGTCLHRGCIPTKALLHAGEIADQSRESAEFGVKSSFEGIDMAGVHKYKDGVISGLYKGLQGLVSSRKVTYVEGTGRLSSPTSVDVNGQRYEGRHILLATGSVPKSLPGLTIDHERVISSDDALVMDRVPKNAIILGGGVIGVEFASVWKSFGTDVTVIEGLKHLVPVEDENSSKLLERAFRKRGIKFNLGTFFDKAEYTADGVKVTLADGKEFEAEVLLVAIGRGPVSEGLGYEEAGVAMDRGFVTVDEYCRTSVPTISAVGDLIPTLQLAHVGFAEGILVAERLAGLNPVPVDYAGVPRVTYCNPEVASVGLTEEQAKERYGTDKIVTLKYNLAGNGRSKILKTTGEVKLVQVRDGAVVGVHMVGDRMGEQVGEAQLIYNWEALPAEVAQLIHAHPTQTEALGEAHLALAGKPLHSHD